jgi:hypothetical protein
MREGENRQRPQGFLGAVKPLNDIIVLKKHVVENQIS